MVAVPSSQLSSRRRSLALIQGSLSSRQIARRAPWLASLHKATDGLLLALGVSMVGLTALTLHWQGQWTESYEKLETSQVLEHRLQESTAVLEQHHLQQARRPGELIPTNIHRLIYVPAPSAAPPSEPVRAQLPTSEPLTEQLLKKVNSTMVSVNAGMVRPGY